MVTADSVTKVHRYLCPGCSSDLLFDPKDGCLACPSCGRTEQIPATAEEVKERSYEDYLNMKPEQANTAPADAGLEVQCTGCGAAVSFAPPDIAGECPFCTAKLVTEPQAAGPALRPESVLPPAIRRDQAVAAIKSWLASRWFAPGNLMRLARQETIQGVYLPFWTYDAFTTTHYKGERGDYYWETESYTDQDERGRSVQRMRQVRRIAWSSVAGSTSRWFDDLLVPGSRSLASSHLAALEPWNLPGLKPYQPSYLAGFKAQRFQVNLREGFEVAKSLMSPLIEQDVRQSIGGDEQRIRQSLTAYSGITFKHLLLPVWMSAYRFQNQVYQVLVNACTGEVQGDRPYSGWKITALVLLIAAIVLLLIYLNSH
jgi:hypothetical protein